MLNYDNTGVTVELGRIVDSGVDVWNFDYPVPAATVTYNGKTAVVPFNKDSFQKKIIDHYRFRQIGMETVGRWLHYFRTRIREIMPYYVQLYEFEAKWFNIDDPLESYNLVETFEQESGSTGKVTGTTTDNTTSETSGTHADTTDTEAAGTVDQTKNGTHTHTRKFLDTPQGSVGTMGDGYLTDYTEESDNTSETNTEENTTTTSVESSGTSSGTGTVNTSGTSEQNTQDSGTLSHTLTRRGNIGVQPLGSEVQNIRDAFINIDRMVIDELKDLFLMVY